MDREEGSPVKVYIYDISRGMASSMSLAFLGKHLDGIWHTGIVVYGQEFFFGGVGIESCQPGRTILGAPDSIHDLGKTEIPFDIFMDYLQDLSNTTFGAECYHLLDHNCNTFSAELAQFLTGQSIPAKITSLPADVLSTPLGQMIRPLIDSVHASPGGGKRIFPSTPSAAATPTGASGSTQHDTSDSKSPSKEQATEEKWTSDVKEFISYSSTVQEILTLHQTSKEAILSGLAFRDSTLLSDVMDYLSCDTCTWSLGRDHITFLVNQIHGKSVMGALTLVCASLLRIALLRTDVIQMIIHDPRTAFSDLVNGFEAQSTAVQSEILKCDCLILQEPNLGHMVLWTKPRQYDDSELIRSKIAACSSQKSGYQYLTQVNGSDCLLKVVTQCCINSLVGDNDQLYDYALAVINNMRLQQITEDTRTEFGIAILQCLNRDLAESTAFHLLTNLLEFMVSDFQIRGLAKVMEIDWSKHKSLSHRICGLVDRILTMIT